MAHNLITNYGLTKHMEVYVRLQLLQYPPTYVLCGWVYEEGANVWSCSCY